MAIELKFEEKPMWHAIAWGLGLAAVLIGVAEWQFFGPRRRDIDAAKAHYASLSAEIEKGRAAERKLAQFREEVKKLELELQKLLQVLPPERITVNPDCGLRHVPAEMARAKLRAMSEGAAVVRAEVLGTSVNNSATAEGEQP